MTIRWPRLALAVVIVALWCALWYGIGALVYFVFTLK